MLNARRCEARCRTDTQLWLRAAGLALLLATPGFAAAPAATANAVTKLAQTGELSCEPALPHFCRNIHVGCAGRLALQTFPFTLRANQSHGWIDPKTDAGEPAAPYRNSSVHWQADGAYVILRPNASDGYIRVLADGTYSFRHYQNGAAAMSYGRCQ
jgi:hypothetical protein